MCESGGKQETTQHSHFRKLSAASLTRVYLIHVYRTDPIFYILIQCTGRSWVYWFNLWVMDQQAADSTGCASPSLVLVRHIFCVQLTCTTDVSSCAAREVQLQKIQWSKSNNSASSETHYCFYNSVFWANLGFEVTVMWIRGSSAYLKIMLIFKIWRKKSANWRSFDFINIFNIFTDMHKIIIWVCIGVDHLIFDPLVTE